MADPFVAEIRIFPFNFAPKGWAWCDGQLMPLSQNTALFSLLGTNFTETRATVLRKITEKPTFKQAEFNRSFVLMEYFGYLRRNQDAAGFNFWLNKLNQFNGNFIDADMVKAFLISTEYRQRFGP